MINITKTCGKNDKHDKKPVVKMINMTKPVVKMIKLTKNEKDIKFRKLQTKNVQ